MLIGVESYYRVEIEELIELKLELVYVSQMKDWAWDKLAWNEYGYKLEYLTFLNGNRSVI